MENNEDIIKKELSELIGEKFIKNKNNENEINSVKEINELIKDEKIKTLQYLDIRDKVIKIVRDDAKKLKNQDSEKIQEKRKKLIDEYKKIYAGTDNTIIKVAFGKKWAHNANENHFNYDYDASLVANYIYRKTIFAKKMDDDIKIIRNGGYKYKISCNDYHFCGDTMNSWLTILNKFLNKHNNGYFADLPKEGYGRIDYLCIKDNYKKLLPSYITEFMKVVYTIGNFIPVPKEPESFNTKRSEFIGDYWDLTLLAIYEYYMYGMPTIAQALLGEWAFWFDDYGFGQAGWDSYVEKNYMQPFVNKIENVQGAKYGLPYELWDGHFNGGMMPEKEEQFQQFFEKATKMILERGKLIATALVKELSKENET